jgi:cystathionine beta-synthase
VLATAHNRLRNAGFSQLPVMKAEQLVGFIDEDAILRHAFGKPERFNDPVRVAMLKDFPVVAPSLPIRDLVGMLETTPYVAVTQGSAFQGLITRADVLNYLRRQMAGAPAP